MFGLSRRRFLAASVGGFAAAMSASPLLLGQDRPTKPFDPRSEPYLPDTLFLTWHRDPTTTMTVQWIGSDWEFNATELSYAVLTPEVEKYRESLKPRLVVPGLELRKEKEDETPKDKPVGIPRLNWMRAPITSRPFPLTNLTVYRVELTNLQPGTEYVFRIGERSPESRFRTMPAKATDSFHFISGGDCGVNSHAIANNALAAKQDPYFVLIGGDLGYDNGRSPRTALAFIRNYAKGMLDSKGRLIPLVVCIGNHEVEGGYAKPRKNAPFFFALFDGLFKDTSFATLDFGDYLSLILLDSGHVAPIGGDQTDWLNAALKARVDRPHLFCVNHVPAYPSCREPEGRGGRFGTGEEQRENWVPLFERYAVDLVLEHHDHTFKRTHPLLDGLRNNKGILYLGDGSWGMLRVPKTPEQRPYLAAVGGSYHFTSHRLEGAIRYHVAMEEGGKLIDICSTTKKARS